MVHVYLANMTLIEESEAEKAITLSFLKCAMICVFVES